MTNKQAYAHYYSHLRRDEQPFEDRQRNLVMGRQMDYVEFIQQCLDRVRHGNSTDETVYRAALQTWLLNRSAQS